MSRFMGAVFGHQLRPILEHHYGPEQHGFRKGHSTVSLLHILEAVISSAMANEEEAVIVQIDVAKAFDKVHRGAVQSFVKNIITPVAPEAADFIKEMYNGDQVEISYGKVKQTISMKSGIRQGDPLSPAIFSALLGHILKPLIIKWKKMIRDCDQQNKARRKSNGACVRRRCDTDRGKQSTGSGNAKRCI